MTCIVGFVEKLKKNTVIWMGGDSAGVDVCDYTVLPRADEKVFKVDRRFLIGICGSFRMGDLLKHSLDAEKQPLGMDTYKYMTSLFVDSVRTTFKKGGFARKHQDVEGIDGSFLVGYKGRLFCIENDYQVAEYKIPFMAIGCGYPFALGSLFTTSRLTKVPTRDKVKLALEASECYSGYVRRPFVIKSLKEIL